MKELYIFCEGPTEQGFCTRVLQPYFFPQHDGIVHPIRIAPSVVAVEVQPATQWEQEGS